VPECHLWVLPGVAFAVEIAAHLLRSSHPRRQHIDTDCPDARGEPSKVFDAS